jgi:protein involved in polysaccharide export with SLBB domain
MKAAWAILASVIVVVATSCFADAPKPANGPPPRPAYVTIYGCVVRQGRYELPAGQNITLTQALQKAGGTTPKAKSSKIKVIHCTAAGNTTEIVNLKTGGKDPILNPQDVIIVDEKMESF